MQLEFGQIKGITQVLAVEKNSEIKFQAGYIVRDIHKEQTKLLVYD